MGSKLIEMKKVRELLQLKFEQGLSARESAIRVGIGKTAASEFIAGFTASGLSLKEILDLSDPELSGVLNMKKQVDNVRYINLLNKFTYFELELKRTGVTLHLLWIEYMEQNADGYAYSQFCYHFQQWRKVQKVSMHIEHKAGDKMYVDYAGVKHSITDPKTGEIIEYEVFVAVLGASQYAYIEAVATQTKSDWVHVNENALRFFGGAPMAIVPDCLKSAVIKADKYEPIINETFNDFGRHYNTTILPARALHPKDKALAEGFVLMAYRGIYAPLRNQIFFSLEELNNAFGEQLLKHNRIRFQGRDYSRQHLFESVERACLRPLPLARYDIKEYFTTKVQYNHYAYLKTDKHYYSVPFRYTGKKVLMSFTSRLVEIYYQNERIATHIRDRTPYEYTFIEEHRPANHQFIAEWSPERFMNWGEKIGPEAKEVISLILQSKSHPEQAFQQCMGILNLEKKHSGDDFLKACKKAIDTGCQSYRFINNTLKNKTFLLNTEEELEHIKIPIHENIRGKEWYN